MLRIGKATKRNRFGNTVLQQSSRTLLSAKACSKAGLQYHVLDAEWKLNYPSPGETQQLVEESADLTTVMTLSAKHLNAHTILRRTVSGFEDEDRVALNLVVGNKAYLGWREIRRPTKRSLTDFAQFARREKPNGTVMIGTEGIIHTATDLAAKYDFIPFLLFDKTLASNIGWIRERAPNVQIAVYVPYLVTENISRIYTDVLRRLSGYLLRRRWVQKEFEANGFETSLPLIRSVSQEKKPLPKELQTGKLAEIIRHAATSLSIFGNEETVREGLRAIANLKADIVVGLPIKESEEQIAALGSCLRGL